jgi:hypothetical protein
MYVCVMSRQKRQKRVPAGSARVNLNKYGFCNIDTYAQITALMHVAIAERDTHTKPNIFKSQHNYINQITLVL